MTLRNTLQRAPDRPGVYVMKDAKGQVIYIGKAASLRSRVGSYFRESRAGDPKTDLLVRQIRDLDYIVTGNELEALILESNLIKKHRPRYNIALRDDKHYPFLKLTTNEDFPRLVVARRVAKDGAAYFGPFYPATAVREMLKLARRLFPLRTCRIKIDGALPRPCVQYAMHRCNAPCTGRESREAYWRTVKDVERFLEGKEDDLGKEMTREMERAAADLRFERAAALRDQIQALNMVRERQKIISTDPVDQDILGVVRQGDEACVQLFFVRKGRLLGRESFFFNRVSGWSDGEILSAFIRQFYAGSAVPAPEVLVSEAPPERDLIVRWLSQRREGNVEIHAPRRGRKRDLVAMAEENAALALHTHLLSRDDRQQVVLEELQRAVNLPGLPHRIEGFDVSNIHGEDACGSVVVWEGGAVKKDEYRRFKIKTVEGADDYAMMGELLRRRYSRALEEGGKFPDLILLDGGRGQLNAGVKALEETGLDYLPIVSLAKRAEEVYTPDSIEPLVLDLTSPALHLLQKIRDEAHRFAVSYHKKLRSRRTIRSVLDQIPGVGPAVRANLLKSFGSARKVREASVAELAAVPKVTPKLAQRIHDFFHPAEHAGDRGPGTGVRDLKCEPRTPNPKSRTPERAARHTAGEEVKPCLRKLSVVKIMPKFI